MTITETITNKNSKKGILLSLFSITVEYDLVLREFYIR